MGGSRKSRTGESHAACHPPPPAASTTGSSDATTCSSGIKPSATIAALVPAANRSALADDSSCISILHPFAGLARPAPHRQIVTRQKTALRILPAADRRQVDPGDGRMLVVGQMPVVIQPHRIDRPPEPEISRPLQDVPGRAEVVHVLHRRPGE